MPNPEELRAPIFAVAVMAAAGYLLGSLPFGYLVAKAHGTNIFNAGSGNPGATNVGRVLGRKVGYTVFALDVLKGVVAAGWPLLWSPWPAIAGSHRALITVGVAGLVGALVGHSFSCFTRFRGGKGVATGAGGFLVLMPAVTLIGGGVWVLLFLTTRYVSLASLAAAVALPVASVFLREPWILTIASSVIAVFVGVRHRANIGRLLAGTEHRWTRKTGGSA